MQEILVDAALIMKVEARVSHLVRKILDRTARGRLFARTDKLASIGLASMDMVSLMLAVEGEFDLEIPAQEITPDAFQSVSAIAALIARIAPAAATP